MPPEERKKAIKKVIEGIPTKTDELFAFPVEWAQVGRYDHSSYNARSVPHSATMQVDQEFVSARIKPWVTKKIIGYMGEDEPSLVLFISSKIAEHSHPR